MIPGETIGRIDIRDPDKLTDGDPVPARSIVTIDPPPLQTSTQTVDDLDRTHYPDLVLDSANGDPRSIWSDGVTLWVGDDADEKVYGYELSGTFGDRDSARDIAGVTTEAFYVTGWGDRLWTGDEGQPSGADHPWAYAFDLPGLARSSGHDFALREGVGVGESTARAISLASGERVTALEFALHADNDHARGIWSNGVTMFVVDEIDDKIYTYRTGDNAAVRVEGAPRPGRPSGRLWLILKGCLIRSPGRGSGSAERTRTRAGSR
ncbi:hypothetical protein [Candidatus Poriferisodalis sp.]|uniref:hypothetical protein n=1 Tax=Candidatus Poriferisodalis sp. TaxID=3101277 RepID=UPI003B5903FD